MLGDSLSAAHNIPTESGWVSLMQQRLQAVNANIDVVNASISGETTDGGLARLPALITEHQPTVVMVELGANDALRGFSLPQIRSNLAEIIRISRDAGAKVGLLGIQIPINYGPRYRRAFGEIYRELAEESQSPLLPFLLTDVALDPSLMQSDGLHPTAEAQPQILENVWPILLETAGLDFTDSLRAGSYTPD